MYGAWGVQLREARSGESYGTANSMMLHFGLGQATNIDSVVIKWPSGISQTIVSPGINQFITVVESECVSPEAHITSNGAFVICTGQTTSLNAPVGYNYLWNTGETTQSISVTQTGEYFVKVSEPGNNCSAVSAAVTLIANPDETPTVTTTGSTTVCSGETVTLNAPYGYASYMWSNGATTEDLNVTASGTYTLTVQGMCTTFPSNAIAVNVLDANAPTATTDTVYAPGGSATLTAVGDSVLWYSTVGGAPIATGNVFTTPTVTSTTTYYAANVTSYTSPETHGAPTYHTGTSLYSGTASINAKMYFDVLAPAMLVSVKVYTDHPGTRMIQLYDNTDALVAQQLVNVQTDTAVVTLNFQIDPGTDYYLTTDATYNVQIANWNSASPRFRRSQGTTVTYPYNIANLVSITNSDQGSNVYYYFYDWVITEKPYHCTSALVPVEVYYYDNIGIQTVSASNVSLYPNPANDMVRVEAGNGFIGARIAICDVTGRVVFKKLIDDTTTVIETSDWTAGLYTVKISANGHENVAKLAIQR
jgi:hypothetical protein